MSSQKIYDLIVEADWQASDSELDHIAFVLESFPRIDWLRALIKEDAPRLAPLMEPPATPMATVHEALLMRCSSYVGKDGYLGRLAADICHDYGRSLTSGAVERIQRKKRPSAAAAIAPEDSVEQRLRDMIVACDAVDTQAHVELVAEILHRFREDVLDLQSLVQDAPRVSEALAKLTAHGRLVPGMNNRTTDHDLNMALFGLKLYLERHQGIVHTISALLQQLFERYGAHAMVSHQDIRALQAAGNWPNKLSIERRPRRQYTCLYVWMIESDHSHIAGTLQLLQPLAESAKVWNKELVEKWVQPLIVQPEERLLKFVVCVAHTREQAKQLAERHAREWQLYRDGHLSEQLDLCDARHVLLIDENERPRDVFVWGEQNYWRPRQEPSRLYHGGF